MEDEQAKKTVRSIRLIENSPGWAADKMIDQLQRVQQQRKQFIKNKVKVI
jgi:cupin superfamily acireductone dioxygenase involved in methionine salvage